MIRLALLILAAPIPQAAPCDRNDLKGNPAPDGPLRTVSEKYTQCVTASSSRLEASGEAAETVATAAVADCEAALNDYAQYVERCSNPRVAQNAAADFRSRARNLAILNVVTKRSGSAPKD